ncbi:hypothetical protein [Fibrella forsythiae]|nr:hypothetical protein [Fibrella forsythiae]
MTLLLLASTIGFVGYCAALIDWIQDYSTGFYRRAWLEATLETSALVIYSYAGIRFLKSKMPFL